MYIHVFTAIRTHLVPNFVKGFLDYKNQENHFFILVSESNFDKELYKELFTQYDNSNYVLVDSFKKLRQVGNRFKNGTIVLHGVPYKWMAYFVFSGFKNVKWVCWGAGARINWKNWKSILFTPIKKTIYQRFNSIAVLMPQDGKSLQRDYKVSNIFLLSYFGTINKFPFTLSDIKCINNSSEIKNVYLGNNSSCIDTYLPLSKKLIKHKDRININCMLNYSFKETDVSRQLETEGKKMYGARFYMDKQLYPLQEYYRYMEKCDIYICDSKKQSGLGAIFTCLRLGKKLFLSGINYEWMKSLGCTVFHVNEIDEMESDVFLKELTFKEKLENYKIIDSYFNISRILDDWDAFLLKK